MSTVLHSGVFTISIDLDLDPSRPAKAQFRPLEEITARLTRLLGQHRVAATWGVADPAVSAAREPLTNLQAGHEIAVLGDASWVGHEAGRSRFARELTRRTTRARAMGLEVTSLLLRGADLTDHWDIAVKHGIRAVRNSTPVAAMNPQQLRYGLWHIPAGGRLPGVSRWNVGGGTWSIRRKIHQASENLTVYHLAIDALRLAEHGGGALHTLDRVLNDAVELRRRNAIQIATLSSAARRLTGARVILPARSILRRAA